MIDYVHQGFPRQVLVWTIERGYWCSWKDWMDWKGDVMLRKCRIKTGGGAGLRLCQGSHDRGSFTGDAEKLVM